MPGGSTASRATSSFSKGGRSHRPPIGPHRPRGSPPTEAKSGSCHLPRTREEALPPGSPPLDPSSLVAERLTHAWREHASQRAKRTSRLEGNPPSRVKSAPYSREERALSGEERPLASEEDVTLARACSSSKSASAVAHEKASSATDVSVVAARERASSSEARFIPARASPSAKGLPALAGEKASSLVGARGAAREKRSSTREMGRVREEARASSTEIAPSGATVEVALAKVTAGELRGAKAREGAGCFPRRGDRNSSRRPG